MQEDFREGSLQLLALTGRARANLDQDESLQARDISLLSGITERSVQNAFSAKGENQLKAEKIGSLSFVDAADALAWLKDKKGFVPTVRVEIEAEGPLPNALNSQVELIEFLKQRVEKKYSTTLVQFFNRTGKSFEEATAKSTGQAPIEIADTMVFADALDISPKWLVTQILRINHPVEAGLLLQS